MRCVDAMCSADTRVTFASARVAGAGVRLASAASTRIVVVLATSFLGKIKIIVHLITLLVLGLGEPSQYAIVVF